PQELFERPLHRFVGYFIGSPGMNFLPCRLANGGIEIAGQNLAISTDLLAGIPEAKTLEIGIRPEAISVAEDGPGLAVQIRDVEDLGIRKIATCILAEHQVKVVVPPEQPVPLGRATLRLNPTMTRLYADGYLVG